MTSYNASTRRAEHLQERIRETTAELVSYRREDLTLIVDATIYELSPDELLPYGIALDVRRRDYIIDVEDLGDFGEPEQGDEISDIHGVTSTVAAMGEEPVFRYSNHTRQSYRIHSAVTITPAG